VPTKIGQYGEHPAVLAAGGIAIAYYAWRQA